MAISINIRMTGDEWADFADWLDVRYSPNGWTFYRDHNRLREMLRNPGPADDPQGLLGQATTQFGDTNVGQTFVLLSDGNEAEEFTLIKLFQPTACVVSHGTFRAPVR